MNDYDLTNLRSTWSIQATRSTTAAWGSIVNVYWCQVYTTCWLSAGDARASITQVAIVRRRTLRLQPPSGTTSTVRGVLDVASACDLQNGDGGELDDVSITSRVTASRLITDLYVYASICRNVKVEFHGTSQSLTCRKHFQFVGKSCSPTSLKRFQQIENLSLFFFVKFTSQCSGNSKIHDLLIYLLCSFTIKGHVTPVGS